VSENYAGLPSLQLQLNAMEVLGFKDPAEGDWSRLHALQYRELHKTIKARICAHVIAAAMVVLIFPPTASTPLIAAWICSLAFAVANVVRIEAEMADLDHRRMSKREFERHAIAILAMASCWAIALFAFIPGSDTAAHFALWTVVAMLVTGSALTTSKSPITGVIWSCICGGAAVISFCFAGEWAFAAAAVIFATAMVNGTLESAVSS